jgi:hypothetical protein
MADKPRIKVSAKHKDGGESISLFAAWDKDDGKLSATMDKRIAQAAFKMEDGTILRITRDDAGKPSHWINIYDDGPTGSRPAQRSSYSAPRLASADDDLPF